MGCLHYSATRSGKLTLYPFWEVVDSYVQKREAIGQGGVISLPPPEPQSRTTRTNSSLFDPFSHLFFAFSP
jgi:hypothetical protein